MTPLKENQIQEATTQMIKGKRRRRSLSVKQLSIIGLASGFAGIILILIIAGSLSKDLPNLEQLETYSPRLITKVVDRNGAILKEFYTERRVQVPLDSIAKPVVHAVLAAEDRKFFR